MLSLLHNLRYSLRMLRKNVGLTATMVLTLALGIGATTAIYTVVYATLIADMPYPKPQELVMVWSTIQGHRNLVSPADYMDWKQQSTVFSGLYAFYMGTMNLGGIEDPEILHVDFDAPGWYTALGVPFSLGRDFLPEEANDGKNQVVILTNRLWRRFGADPKILGKTLQLDQKPYTVVGVLASGQPDNDPWDLIVPLVIKPGQISHDAHWLNIMGRLKDGVTMAQANAQMAAVAANITRANPRTNTGWSARVESLKNDWLSDTLRLTLWLFLGASGFVLLIACVNIANLLLAKGMTRQKEIAIRSAVGATRRSVFAQFITESLLLAVLGGGLGAGLGYALLRGIIAAMPWNTLPGDAVLTLSIPVLLVTLAATTLSGLLFGCAPAWYASRVDPAESLKEGGRSGSSRLRNRLHRLLVVGEFALALTLLAGAGMAIHSFWNLYHIDTGVETDHTLTFILPISRVGSTPEQSLGYYQQVIRRIQSVPGVQSASASTGLPLEGTFFRAPFSIAGQAEFADPSKRPNVGLSGVTPDYLKTFGIRLVEGRFFTEADNATSLHVAVVNELFVKHYLAGKDPIGQVVNIPPITPQSTPAMLRTSPFQPWVIVGVIHDVHGGMLQTQYEEIDVPFYQDPFPVAAVGVRTARDPETMRRSISAAVHSIDPTVPLNEVATLDEIRDKQLVGQRFILFLYIGFAVLALTLAAVGIYGVMAFSVGQREHEIGVRMALGASRNGVVGMVMREGAMLALVGSLLGLGGAYAVGRALRTILFGVTAFDLTAFTAVAALLLAAALVASWLPARRAASIEPMQALRTE
jgi:putative ABC transport system permease protein